ncbi:MAG: LysR family transcriptional regulator [Pseudomonadota bacterium]
MTPITRFDFDAVLAFAVFADSLNFSAAARQLHLSQPALHVKIRKLSDQLGRPLYRRIGRTLELTEHGHLVARYGQNLGLGAREFVGQLEGSAEQAVTLAAGDGAYLYLLGAGIRSYQHAAKASLHLLSTDRDRTLAAVLGGKAQVGVAPLDSVPEAIHSAALTTVGQVLAVPATHRLAGRSRLRLKDLAGERLIVPPSGRPHRQTIDALLQSEQVDWQLAMEANGWELMLSFVAMDIGVAIVNACCRLPKGVVGMALPQMPSVRYHCFHLQGLAKSSAAMRLRMALVSHGDAWKT